MDNRPRHGARTRVLKMCGQGRHHHAADNVDNPYMKMSVVHGQRRRQHGGKDSTVREKGRRVVDGV